MKKLFAFLGLAAALAAAGSCAVAPVTGKNDAAKRYFDAWTLIHYPNAPKTAFGSVIIDDKAGIGELIGSIDDTPYVYCDFVQKDLDGNIGSCTDVRTAQQIGTYAESYYYGPQVVTRLQGRNYSGVAEMMETMRVGGTRTAAIPGWLMTADYYETPEEYLKNCSGTDAIYTFTVREAIKDIVLWEIDSLSRYMRRHYPGVDSTVYGYYYIQTAEPLDTTSFESGTTVYVDYTGRLLNGQVFDSTIQDTTKKYRIYVDGTTYEPSSMSWPSEETSTVTFSSGGTAIDGFERCVHNMKAGEKGICIFYSSRGYGMNGSGSTIPPYSPLMFEVHMLGKNEDGSIDTDDTDS